MFWGFSNKRGENGILKTTVYSFDGSIWCFEWIIHVKITRLSNSDPLSMPPLGLHRTATNKGEISSVLTLVAPGYPTPDPVRKSYGPNVSERSGKTAKLTPWTYHPHGLVAQRKQKWHVTPASVVTLEVPGYSTPDSVQKSYGPNVSERSGGLQRKNGCASPTSTVPGELKRGNVVQTSRSIICNK